MAVIDDAVQSYLASLGVAEDEFIKDIQEMEESGLSGEEILAALATLNVATYLIEDLGMSAAINTQMDFTEQLLDDLPFFGNITENQLVALQNVQRSSIVKYTEHLGERIRQEIITGTQLGLNADDIKDRLARSVNVSRIDTVIDTAMTNYQQQVIYTMTEEFTNETRWVYEGPLDNKTRPVCREILAMQPFTRDELESRFSGAFTDRGGPNCRHLIVPLSSGVEYSEKRAQARNEIKQKKRSGKYKKPETIKEYYERTKS
tara:strand:- start:1443 stop:2225 length:783 start_codon:yes stop_codon:yes gene_type:complete